MNLRHLLKDIKFECIKGNLDISISDILYDSRKVVNNSLFICISGVNTDGHDYIHKAVEKGAIAIVVEKDMEVNDYVTVIRVESTRVALAYLSAAYFNYPAKELKTIAVTGTKGKTTTTYMIKEVLDRAEKKTGLIGTIGAVILDEHRPLNHTTPMSYDLHKLFREMADSGCEYVIMETSSQGFKLDRTAGIEFDYGIFTNFSPDHIGPGEHETLEEYLFCKSMLFKQCKKGIINKDDKNWKKITAGHTCEIMTYGCMEQADLVAEKISFLKEKGKIGVSFQTKGSFDKDIRLYIREGLVSIMLWQRFCCALICK
jgi:UDP-N-acetylmuramoyl-L-alanyl-D-glutamate--2,6-diaminopimelate ligase